MNTKKIVAMVIALIMTTAIFAGCGNTVDHKDTEVSSTVETTIDKDVDKTVEEESDEKSETADKADKENSKETSNKAEKPNDNKTEVNKSDKDKNSANSSVSKPSNSGNANNNGSASKPSTPAKPNKPSGNSNSGSSNNGNHNGSVNKPSKPVEKPSKPVEKPVEKPSEKPSEPQKPAPHVHNYNTMVSSTNGDCSHVGKVTKKCSCGATVTENGSYGDHNWQDQYKEVYHDAKYENRPVYKWVAYHECRKCGFQTEDDDAILLHSLECGGTYTTKEKQIQTGTESVQVEKPWTERVPDGKKCTICGTHKH